MRYTKFYKDTESDELVPESKFYRSILTRKDILRLVSGSILETAVIKTAFLNQYPNWDIQNWRHNHDKRGN